MISKREKYFNAQIQNQQRSNCSATFLVSSGGETIRSQVRLGWNAIPVVEIFVKLSQKLKSMTHRKKYWVVVFPRFISTTDNPCFHSQVTAKALIATLRCLKRLKGVRAGGVMTYVVHEK